MRAMTAPSAPRWWAWRFRDPPATDLAPGILWLLGAVRVMKRVLAHWPVHIEIRKGDQYCAGGLGGVQKGAVQGWPVLCPPGVSGGIHAVIHGRGTVNDISQSVAVGGIQRNAMNSSDLGPGS